MSKNVFRKQPITLGVTLPFSNALSTYESLLRMARTVDDAGFDSVWMADHLTGPSPNGTEAWFDVITLLANLCAHVPRLVVGTDVVVVAHRHPVVTAKMLTTLDHVSGGKLIVGAGVGYIEKEFSDLGVPFDARGRYTDECLQVWKAMWGPGRASFSGEFFQLEDVVSEPKPVQPGGPPVWVGSAAPPVLRRAVRFADGWHPISLSIDQYASGSRTLGSLAEEEGRSAPLTLSYSGMYGMVEPDARTAEGRFPLTGNPDQVLGDIEQLRSLGVTNFVFRPGGIGRTFSTAEICDQIEFIAQSVLPRVTR